MTKPGMRVIAAIGWLLAASPAGAAELLLAHPSACTIGDELSSRTERALGRPLAAAAALRCTIHIVHDQGAFAARLELERQGQPSQLRSFHAPSCDKLRDRLTLALVLAIVASGRTSSELPTSNGLVVSSTSGSASTARRSGGSADARTPRSAERDTRRRHQHQHPPRDRLTRPAELSAARRACR
jgi:hypothetical protein